MGNDNKPTHKTPKEKGVRQQPVKSKEKARPAKTIAKKQHATTGKKAATGKKKKA